VTRLFALGLILLTVLGSVWGLSASSKAQTPDAQSGTPVAATCEGDPRPMDFLVTIVAAPKPEISPTAIAAIPTGEPVDDETRTAVVRVVETLTACVNAGDYLRAFALFDDEYLRRIIDPDSLMSGDVAFELGKSLATPSSTSDEAPQVSIAITSVQQLADGTVTVVFTTTDDTGDSTTDLYVLAKRDTGWRIVDGARDLGN
jgi:hypothetical protein